MQANYIAAVGHHWGVAAVSVARRSGEYWHFVFDKDSLESECQRLNPRFVFLLNWRWIVPASIHKTYETVNFHASNLPFFRGGTPIEHQIDHGISKVPITAHRVTEILDGGPIYAKSKPVYLYGTKEQIVARFVEPTALLMRKIIDEYPRPVPQDGLSTTFKRMSDEKAREIWARRSGWQTS